jgi:hypothetical protein
MSVMTARCCGCGRALELGKELVYSIQLFALITPPRVSHNFGGKKGKKRKKTLLAC